MLGQNPIRPPEKGDGLLLQVTSIFPTLQGEGPYAGRPAVFIRLGGCNLACDFCDTEFEDFSPKPISEVIANVDELASINRDQAISLVVITGGEPMRQNIAPLCERLIENGYQVQIETNGTLYRPLPEQVDIVCSPKNTGGGYHPIRADLLPHLSAIKFILSESHPGYGQVAEVGQSKYDIPVYVQPMDELDEAVNAGNHRYAIAMAHKHGYRLSVQLHKILGID